MDRPGHDVDAGIAVVLGDVAVELADRSSIISSGAVAGMMGDRLTWTWSPLFTLRAGASEASK